MNKLTVAVTATAVFSIISLGSIVFAAQDFNSSRSNVNTVVGGDGGRIPVAISYSYTLNFSVEPNTDGLDAQQYETLVDAALAEMRKNLITQRTEQQLEKKKKKSETQRRR